MEGNDDKVFSDNIIRPVIQRKYQKIHLIKYSELKTEKVLQLIDSTIEIRADYIFITDIDKQPCPSGRKNEVREVYHNLDDERIQIVIKKIESWYLAGLDDKSKRKLNIVFEGSTDNLGRGKFNKLFPKHSSMKAIKNEILNYFDIDTAILKNQSFKYFYNKYLS